MITSAGNSRIQHLRRLSGRRSARLDSGAFVVDGPVLVAEALAGPLDVLEVFVGEHAQPPDTSAMGAAPEIVVCADGLLERVLSTRAPQPMAAVVALPALDLAALAGRSGDVLVLDRLGDPGNAGTLIRAAEAAGWSAVVFSSNSVDPFAPKVVRASAGSVLRVPVIATDVSAIEVLAALAPRTAVAAVAAGGTPHLEMQWPGDAVLVIGNEAHGIGPEVIDACGMAVTIEMDGPTESLNAAMAGTVLMFEVLRARRSSS